MVGQLSRDVRAGRNHDDDLRVLGLDVWQQPRQIAELTLRYQSHRWSKPWGQVAHNPHAPPRLSSGKLGATRARCNGLDGVARVVHAVVPPSTGNRRAVKAGKALR